ncbi:LysR family transcriptional regulator [Polaromonas sp. SM01]|uniref:LysR family transcriptional regulator n=1 Tax=Polaromonas sp. SM01 TaxID=3085630 RepID=UPI0029817F51|nr:LysR family transcriptional regulator [Polaromonas sp. SM01]MDW5444207.1 LysR family transcriptional regulator [Polaromonas sp. SM01]
MNINLRDLGYFEVVAELGHLGQAAERLGRSQPALSKCMQRLEASFGAPLFSRAGRGIQLTAVGEVLLARARLLRGASEEALREVSDFAQGHAGHVRIGSGPIAADHVLPTLCQLLLSEAPSTTIDITVGPSMALREQLREGNIDLLIGLVPTPDALFQTHPLFEDAAVVATSPDHPVFALPQITLQALLAYGWALPAASIPSRQWLDAVFQSRGLALPRVQISANSIPLLPALIRRTGLLSFVSRRTLGRGSHGVLKEVPLPETTLQRTLGVTYRRDGYLSPAARRLLSLLQSRGESLLADAAAQGAGLV